MSRQYIEIHYFRAIPQRQPILSQAPRGSGPERERGERALHGEEPEAEGRALEELRRKDANRIEARRREQREAGEAKRRALEQEALAAEEQQRSEAAWQWSLRLHWEKPLGRRPWAASGAV